MEKYTVIPIPKHFEGITDPLLLAVVCKIQKIMVNARLIWYLETNKLITEYHSGFRIQRSPIDHLIRLETFIKKNISGSFVFFFCLFVVFFLFCFFLFFDLEKAYDTIWKYGIVKYLKNLGLEGRIFIQTFLQYRQFRVRMGEVFSLEKQQLQTHYL